jgi:hypothetical protein
VLDGNEVDIYMNKHDGTYSGPVSFKVGVNPDFIVARDINNDGKIDLISANHDSNDVSVLLGNGDGTFKLAKSYAAGTHPNALTTGDFNGDGKIDLAIGGDQATILLGHGDGTFGSASTFAAHGPVTFIAQIPTRGNGIEDLLTVSTDFSGNTVPGSIYLLSGRETAPLPLQSHTQAAPIPTGLRLEILTTTVPWMLWFPLGIVRHSRFFSTMAARKLL